MGFYTSATLIKDAQRRGVRFRSVCVCESQWACTIEVDGAIRLGLCMVKGLQRERAGRLITARPFGVLGDLQARVRLTKEEWRTLAEIGAFAVFGKQRREVLWTVEDEYREDDLFPTMATSTKECPLPPMNPAERVRADYAGTSVTIGKHPMALLRPSVPEAWRAADLAQASHGVRVRIAGNVICRQRPGTAKGVVFISLEDETGIANAIVHPWLFEQERLLITQEAFLVIEGVLQAKSGTQIVQAEKIERVSHGALPASVSHDFR
jgi:error-prone DNA polymerase